MKEFVCFSGIKRLREKITHDSFHEFKVIYYPVKEIDYQGKKIIYQVFQTDDSSSTALIIPGFKESEYLTPKGELAMGVEVIPKKEISEIEKLVHETIRQNWPINFWSQ